MTNKELEEALEDIRETNKVPLEDFLHPDMIHPKKALMLSSKTAAETLATEYLGTNIPAEWPVHKLLVQMVESALREARIEGEKLALERCAADLQQEHATLHALEVGSPVLSWLHGMVKHFRAISADLVTNQET